MCVCGCDDDDDDDDDDVFNIIFTENTVLKDKYIVNHIFECLDADTIFSCSFVNKLWHTMILESGYVCCVCCYCYYMHTKSVWLTCVSELRLRCKRGCP